MNTDHLWAVIPAVCVVLLHLDTFVSDATRGVRWLIPRVLGVKGGAATWT
jgi:hypothetical protein